MKDSNSGCGCFLIAIAVAFSCGLIYFLAAPIVTVSSLAFAGYGIVLYSMGVADALNLGTKPYPVAVRPPPDRHVDGRDPAWPHYLYGPALTDFGQCARLGFRLPFTRFRTHERWIRSKFFRQYADLWMLSYPLGGLLWLGLVCGAAMATFAITAVALFQLTTWLVFAVLAFVLLQTLRGADTVRLRIKGIRLFCPSCHQRVIYPVYVCPACDRQHRDVRPGRYGVLTRMCVCGHRMPTLLLLGSSGLVASCPHCEQSMADNAGTSAEFVLPVLGDPSSGKTRLMLAMILALRDGNGTSAEFADEPSRESFEKFAPVLRTGGDTWKTRMAGDAPLRAYSLYVTARRRNRRLLHLFDPAGEVLETAERLQAQRYVKAARTFVFTLDQLSVEPVWQALAVPDRAKYRRYRSARPPEHVFGQILDGIEGQGVDTKRSRLAVALTKQDLVKDHVPDGDNEAIMAWLKSPEIGLVSMVRSMELAFAEIRFFRTSSRVDGASIDPAIAEMTRWILNGEGLRISS